MNNNTNNTGRETMISQQRAFEVSMEIAQNEGRDIAELTDAEIEGYMVDKGIEETDENIAAIRNA